MEWTDDEMIAFARLVDMAGSQDQMHRITSRLEMPAFIEKHGKDKCDAMFQLLCGGDDGDE